MSRLKVFLDTNVLVSYLVGNPEAQKLFDRDVTRRVEYIVSPLVLQELLLTKENPDEIKRLPSRHLTVKEFDVDTLKTFVERFRKFRNTLVHANDVLNIQVAATTADLFVTQDKELLSLKQVDKVKVVSPEEFFESVDEAA